MNQVLVKGNVVEGFQHFGPFETRTDAFQHMKDVSDHETDWVVADLLPPVNQVEDLTPEQWQEGMKLTQIGTIDAGIDGKDVYVLVKRLDGENLSVDLAVNFAMSRMCFASNVPGTAFCDIVRGHRIGSPPSTVLCVAEIRYDI